MRLDSLRIWPKIIATVLVTGVVWTAWRGQLTLGGPITHLSLAILYACFILIPLQSPAGILNRILSTNLLRWLGTISYAVFLIHVPMSALAHGFIRSDAPSIGSWSDAAVTATALAATLITAQLSYWLIERQMIAFGHRVKY
jgi:peptidoglycan/LPS O-acetylase OafA/YrhL